MTLARSERAALSDRLDRTDPDQPTLCEGWTARDLLAHLLVRERQPWAAGGIVIPFLAPLTAHAMRGYADTPWEQMVEELRSGPPAWSPSRIGRIDEASNGAEFFVHHEDVRRADGRGPRTNEPAMDEALCATSARRPGSSPDAWAAPGSSSGGQRPPGRFGHAAENPSFT